MNDIILSIKDITKTFSNTKVLNNLSLEVYTGEFLTLLGPSGCGKTTTLRSIAGLEQVDSGQIFINGIDITFYEPNKRNVNTVFQNYALFPHMNVYDNIAYGPKIKKHNKDEIKNMVQEMLKLLKMDGLEKRMPHQLSGGQRQRIAIARAIVNKPDILLLDEPLGALDLKLRHHMQSELKRIQKQTGITFIYVTHDQDEALNMSDRLVIMNNGNIEQIGTPEEVYLRPISRFVAEFIGERNIFEVKVIENEDNKVTADFFGYKILAKGETRINNNILIAVHSDKMKIEKEKINPFYLKGTVQDTYYTGSQIKTIVKLEHIDFSVRVLQYEKTISINQGDTVYVGFDINDGVIIKKG